jgi:SPX domain protein involved in polyphosphate accumulation
LHHHVPLILAGHELPPQNFPTDIKSLRQFQLYVKYLNARPMVLVRYMREAYEGEGDSRVRVKFDRGLTYCVSEEPRVRLGGTGWLPVALNFTVLEIKFTSRYPGWLSELVRAFDLKVSSMSKYASSVRQSIMSGFSAPRYAQMVQLFA